MIIMDFDFEDCCGALILTTFGRRDVHDGRAALVLETTDASFRRERLTMVAVGVVVALDRSPHMRSAIRGETDHEVISTNA